MTPCQSEQSSHLWFKEQFLCQLLAVQQQGGKQRESEEGSDSACTIYRTVFAFARSARVSRMDSRVYSQRELVAKLRDLFNSLYQQ